ncbi:ABC transporter substrate-binding protein [Phaeobacter sp. HF9A]|uniref:ABC transporter substrate-binding protein n=1 Tax=Phaeobacter sp. HF9A TaxID=2721561 RepID=UPI001430B688|nr:ABC transporter substrate-binding protein [Phaeobacter sp. HF9A]NIZ13568.1 ABC transporter substrate-binding protein [Phaeobacter sp. HF9A]
MMKLNRRRLLQTTGAALCAPAVLSRALFAKTRALKVGYVAPRSGALGAISEGDGWAIEQFRELMGGTIETATGTYDFEFIDKDTQSDPNRAADMAQELILRDEVDLILVSSTADTTNPVCDVAELNGVPCVSTATPWQPWFFGRGGVAGETTFRWTNHYFWGAEDLTNVYLELWNSLETNKVVGGLWPNDPDGAAFADPELGFPPALEAAGFTVVDAGRYQNLKDDFSAEIAAFKKAGVEIVTGVMLPPDLATFLVQAKQQGFEPKMVTVAKAALTPKGIEAMPNGLGNNLSGEVYWGPQFPFASSLTGQTATDLIAAYEAATGNQWIQSLGYIHSLTEVAVDVLRRATEISPEGIMAAVNATDLTTIVGHVKWGDFPPFANVAKTPLAGGQWQKQDSGAYALIATNNGHSPELQIGGTLEYKTW